MEGTDVFLLEVELVEGVRHSLTYIFAWITLAAEWRFKWMEQRMFGRGTIHPDSRFWSFELRMTLEMVKKETSGDICR